MSLIAPGLVELALYSGWYPRDPALGAFTYEVELALPAGWTVVTGGRVLSTHTSANRQRTRFVSAAAGTDLALVASPVLVVRRARSGAAAVEVYAPAADSALATSASAQLGEALRLYGDWFGAARTGSLPTRLVYSPRSGWGYSRLPLIAVSADGARSWSGRPMGEARIFAGNAHELAHFWWQIADTKTDDWINEGLAEFSSFSAAGVLFGDAMRDTLLAGYRRDVARARTTTPIATTTSDSPDRYINHYEKTALLFAAIERSVGRPALTAFLRSFYAAHAGRRDATTAGFLADAGRALGGEVAARLERCVTSTWTEDCGQ